MSNGEQRLSFKGVPYSSRLYALARFFDRSHLERVAQMLNPQPGQCLLEIGAGRGHMVAQLRSTGVDAVGIEVNESAVQLATTPRVEHQSATAMNFPDHRFDLVLAIHVIEHIADSRQLLSEVMRVAKPNAKILFIYPAEPVQGLYAILASFALYGHPFGARRIHCHKFTPKAVASLANAVGLEHVQSQFWWLSHPQYGSLLRKP